MLEVEEVPTEALNIPGDDNEASGCCRKTIGRSINCKSRIVGSYKFNWGEKFCMSGSTGRNSSMEATEWLGDAGLDSGEVVSRLSVKGEDGILIGKVILLGSPLSCNLNSSFCSLSTAIFSSFVSLLMETSFSSRSFVFSEPLGCAFT